EASDELVARPIDDVREKPAGTMAQPATPVAEPAPAAPVLEQAVPGPAPEAPSGPRSGVSSPRYAAQRAANRGRGPGHESAAAAASEPARPDPRPALEADASADKPEPVVAAPEPKAIEPFAPAPAPAAAPAAPAPVVAVAPPKPSAPKPDNRPLDANASFADISAQGSLGSSTVNRMLGRATSLMKACYQSAARAAGRNDFAPVAISLTIDEAGAVRSPKAGAHALPGLAACITDGLKKVRSDQKPDVGVVRVEAQVSFRPL
ncbi:MAG TPA: hypothetical protein VFZ61_19725, partial [Polyangiales bacterium]